MKKILVCLLAVVMLLSLAACGGSDGKTTTATQPNSNKPNQPTDTFSFTYNGTEVKLHADAAPIVAALGEPKSYTEEASCAFEGLDKTYTYDSFVLQTYPTDGKDYVLCFWFLDDFAKTDEGIKIGDSQEAVGKAYGADAYNGTNAYILKKGDCEFTVILKDGVVNSIKYSVVIG